MPFDGNGNYSAPAGTNAVTGTVIDSTKYNAFVADVAAALSGLLKRDGQSAMQANLPMGGYKLVGLGDGSAASDGVNLGQLNAFASAFMKTVLDDADAAAAQATLNVPSRTGSNASGTWGISISGNAATATTATNSTQLGGVAASGYQTALGFTPVQQNGAFGMGTNRIRIGWGASSEGLRLVVDETDFANVWPITPEENRLRSQLGSWGPGGVGTYALMYGVTVNAGDLVAGSSLRLQGMARNADNVMSTPNGSGPIGAGTWRSMSSISSGTGTIGLYLRVS